MTFKKKYKIGANDVELRLKPYSDITSDCDGGLANWERNTIDLGSDLPEDRQSVAFLHELLHMINIKLEEEEVTYLSEALMQVIRDNKINFLK